MYVQSGLWLAKQWSVEKGVEHYAIIGPSSCLGGGRVWGPVVLELMPAGPRVRTLGRDEVWKTEPIHDLAGARKRIKELTGSGQGHRYDAISNNCEHWARYIAFGESRSEQVRGLVTAALLVAAIVILSKQGLAAA